MIKVNFLSYYLLVIEVGNGVFQSFPIGCLVFQVSLYYNYILFSFKSFSMLP